MRFLGREGVNGKVWVSERRTGIHCRSFRVDDGSTGSLAEVLEIVAKWLREHSAAVVWDITVYPGVDRNEVMLYYTD